MRLRAHDRWSSSLEAFFSTILGRFSYFGLFGVLLAAGLGLPIPEDIPLITSGWIVHKNDSNLGLMMLTGLAGVLIGDSIMFHMGRKYGAQIMEHRWFSRVIRPWLLQRARQLYDDHGAKMLFAARYMPGIRSAMYLSAGTFGVPYWKFLLIDGSAAMISVPLWIWAGWKFSGQIEHILGGARTATIGISSMLVTALVVWAIWEYRRLKKEAAKTLLASAALASDDALRRESGGDNRPRTPQRSSKTSVAG
jgi:membrane protein DedA with SNARE-associated domain